MKSLSAYRLVQLKQYKSRQTICQTQKKDYDTNDSVVHQLRLSIAHITKSDPTELNNQLSNLISGLSQNRNEISHHLITLLQGIRESMQNHETQTYEQFGKEKSLLLLKLQQLEVSQKKKENTHRIKLRTEIREMQDKLVQMSQKEKKLIQLVKAVQSRGIDISIYKNMKVENSIKSVSWEEDSYLSSSGLADQSLNNTLILKRNTFFID